MSTLETDLPPMSSTQSTQSLDNETKSRDNDAMILDTDQHKRTDHDRQGEVAEPSPAAPSAIHDLLAGKGKEREGNIGHDPSLNLRVGPERPDDGMGPLYLVCKSPHPKTRPHPSQNLISLYNLDQLAAGVARTDPITGEKINKLRKSYEGKVKDMGLSGKNKAVKNPEGSLGLLEMVQWPDDEWQIQKVAGKDVENGLGDELLTKLEQAMAMERGELPDDKRWVEALALDPPTQAQIQTTTISAKKNQTQQISYGNGATPRTANAVGSTPNDPPRPKRIGRKRRYDEHSFEGYGEGYLDDDVEMVGGDSAGEDDEERRGNSSKKKRRKDYGGPQSPGLGDRGGPYAGMVGVGSYSR